MLTNFFMIVLFPLNLISNLNFRFLRGVFFVILIECDELD